MIVLPWTSACDAENGELPKSKPDGARPRTSPIQSWPTPALRNANASSTLLTTTILAAPRASTTAAVVKARNTSMITTDPVARSAPESRLSMRTSIIALPSCDTYSMVVLLIPLLRGSELYPSADPMPGSNVAGAAYRKGQPHWSRIKLSGKADITANIADMLGAGFYPVSSHCS